MAFSYKFYVGKPKTDILFFTNYARGTLYSFIYCTLSYNVMNVCPYIYQIIFFYFNFFLQLNIKKLLM